MAELDKLLSEINKLPKPTDYSSLYLLAQQAFENGFRGMTVNELVVYLSNNLPDELTRSEFIYEEYPDGSVLPDPGRKASLFLGAGTYTTPGGTLELTENFNIVGWDGADWNKVLEVPIEVIPPENKIKDFVPGETCVGGANPDQRIWKGQLWSVNPEVASTTEEPGTGADWSKNLQGLVKENNIGVVDGGTVFDFSIKKPDVYTEGEEAVKAIEDIPLSEGGWISVSDGSEQDSLNITRSDFIETVGFNSIETNNDTTPAGGTCFYDENKVFISGVANTGSPELRTIPIPEGAAYVRGCTRNVSLSNAIFRLVDKSLITDSEIAFIYPDKTKVINFVKEDIFNKIFQGREIGKINLDGISSTVVQTTTRALAPAFDDNYIIESITFNASRPGMVTFIIFSPNGDGTFSTKKRDENGNFTSEDNFIFYNAPVIGIQSFKPYTHVEKGGLLGVVLNGTEGSVGFKLEPSSPLSYSFGDGIVTGEALTPSTANNVILGAYYEVIKSPYENNVTISDNKLPTSGLIEFVNFRSADSLPKDWVNTGGWGYSSAGLTPPPVGGWDKPFYWTRRWNIDRDHSEAYIVINNINSVFSFMRTSDQGGGTVFEYNGPSESINIYSLAALGGTPGSPALTEPIPFNIVPDRVYKMIMRKESEVYYFDFIDTVTLDNISIMHDSVGNTSVGKMRNGNGFVFISGDIRVLSSYQGSISPKSPIVQIVGDSITDGDTIRNIPGGGYTNRWAGLLSTALDGDITIFARGGESTTDVNGKLQDIYSFMQNPQFIIYALGMNDSDLNTYISNFNNFKERFSGVEVIPVTLFPRTGRESFNLAVSNWIKLQGTRYFDWRKALTVDGLGIERDASLFLDDNLHPNVAGHLRLFNQLKADVPELFY